jgi:hypothetical protein
MRKTLPRLAAACKVRSNRAAAIDALHRRDEAGQKSTPLICGQCGFARSGHRQADQPIAERQDAAPALILAGGSWVRAIVGQSDQNSAALHERFLNCDGLRIASAA